MESDAQFSAFVQMTVENLREYLGDHGSTVHSVYLDGKLEGFSTPEISPLLPVPWHLDRIDQPDQLLDGYFTYSNKGSGVSIYIVDTGIKASHSEFKFMDGREGGGQCTYHIGFKCSF